MADNASPKGLHRRIEAQERRVGEIESAMVSLQSTYAAASRPEGDAAGAVVLAERLAQTQGGYDDALLVLRVLQAMARRLRDWGLSTSDTASWASVCRKLGLPSTSRAHSTLRSREPVLHVLLHRCAFLPYCAIDSVSYRG